MSRLSHGQVSGLSSSSARMAGVPDGRCLGSARYFLSASSFVIHPMQAILTPEI